MIDFHLDTHSGVPAYLQVGQQGRQAVRLGTLRRGAPARPAKRGGAPVSRVAASGKQGFAVAAGGPTDQARSAVGTHAAIE